MQIEHSSTAFESYSSMDLHFKIVDQKIEARDRRQYTWRMCSKERHWYILYAFIGLRQSRKGNSDLIHWGNEKKLCWQRERGCASFYVLMPLPSISRSHPHTFAWYNCKSHHACKARESRTLGRLHCKLLRNTVHHTTSLCLVMLLLFNVV